MVYLEEMAHVFLHGYHLDVVAGKHRGAVLHDGGFLAAEDKGVERLVRCIKTITSQLVVADVGAELYETVLAARQGLVMVGTFQLYVETLAGVHGETVYHHLAELAMVAVGLAEGFPGRQAESLTVKTVVHLPALVEEKTEGNDKHRREYI